MVDGQEAKIFLSTLDCLGLVIFTESFGLLYLEKVMS
jgi:hypothetical protein